jgi:type VI secretion system protein ImpH
MADVQERPYAFGFYQAMRIIECCYADRARFGTAPFPANEPPVRLAQEPGMHFESASLTAFEAGSGERPARLSVRFFGLLGPNGPLPLHLTEYAQHRQRQHKDRTFARFLDIFHHRMLSLFYRAWANHQPTVSFDRRHADRFSAYVGALVGLGMSALRNRDAIDDLTKFYYCGHLSLQTKPSDGLQAVLSGFFGVPVRIDEFVGGWMELPEKVRSRLGVDPDNGVLGESVTIGTRAYGRQHMFRIVLGPLSLPDFESFLPPRERTRLLVALVRNYIGDEMDWKLALILREEEVPMVRLDGRYHLGWTTWLGNRPGGQDADDLVFDAFAHHASHSAEDTHRDGY